MAPDAEPVVQGQPLTQAQGRAIDRWDRVMRVPIILSAVLPLIVVPQSGSVAGIVVGIVTWLVFLADFVVQERRRSHYLRTGLGRFDLAVVILTAPWFLLPGATAGSFVVLLRLARLVRLLIVTRGVRKLVERLGRVALVAGAVVLVGSAVAYYAEHPTNPGFATFGDAIWWGVVTLTTVGYGDIVPETATGRWAGFGIMIMGISVVGLLAGTLASFFHLEQSDEDRAAAQKGAVQEAASDDALLHELTLLREQVQRLADRIDGQADGQADGPG